MSDEPRVDRRAFFRQGLRELLKPLAGAAEPLHEAIRQLDKLEAMDEKSIRPTQQNDATEIQSDPPIAAADKLDLPVPSGVATRKRKSD